MRECYRFLDTLAEIIFCASLRYDYEGSKNNYMKERCIIDVKYLVNELSQLYKFDLEYASKLIDRYVFHESNNKDDDIFAQPLIKISLE